MTTDNVKKLFTSDGSRRIHDSSFMGVKQECIGIQMYAGRERERETERERGLGFGFRVQGLGPWVVGFRVFFSSLRALKQAYPGALQQGHGSTESLFSDSVFVYGCR